MDYAGLSNAVKYSKAYKRKKLRLRIVAFLAAVVVFVTTYILILPAATKERTTYCGLTEHKHNSECLAEACALTEHSHTERCYVNFAAELETQADWEATLPETLSGKWYEDVIAVAESQLGYRESGTNFATGDEATPDETVGGYTRYGEWNGTPYAEWESLFVNFCLTYAGVNKDYFPYSADNAEWVKALEEKELITKVPKKGDIVFFRKGNRIDIKVGVVSELIFEGDRIIRFRTIEGNSDNRVRYNEYSVTAESIYGFGDMTAAYEEFYKDQPRVKHYSDDNVTILATYPSTAGIPDGAEFVVKPILRQDSPEEFDNCYEEAFNRLDSAEKSASQTEITGFRLYDIHFLYNGEEIQPTENVEIKISYPITAYSKTADISVVHYVENGTELPEAEHSFDNLGNVTTEFETNSFSLFAIVTSETVNKSLITLTPYSVTANSTLRALGGMTFALVNGGYALDVKDNALISQSAAVQDNATNLTTNESAARWTFEKSGTYTYYIHTTIDGTKYYLYISGGSLTLNSTGTLFTAAMTNGSITLSSGGSYVNVNSNGGTAGSSQAISLYQIPTGSFTVTFDGTIGNAQYMSSNNHKFSNATVITKTTDADGYITLPTVEEAMATEPANYPVTLNGWYDIKNAIYYDKTMFGMKIKVTSDTIFYPEWIAATYDIGQNKNVVEGQPDTSGFINTYVFDYNELFNVHSSKYNPSDNKWYFDAESELGFIFFDYICHEDWGNDWSKTGGNIGYMSDKDAEVDGVTVNAEKTNGTRGSSINFPGTITSGIANDARLEALFGNTPIVGRVALGEGDWLYNYDAETGYYYYNSAKNAASYNQSEQRFYVYNHIVTIDSQNSLNDFLPFNYADADTGDTEFAEKDNEANYWFGMKSEIKFYLPDDTGTGGNKAANGVDDMQFRFSGDDDVWVFVDGQLVLDLGGVHDVVYGEINFSTGVVKTGQAISSTAIAENSASSREEMPGLTGAAGITESTLSTLEGGVEHTLTVYYLERGSSLSNCAVYFNLSPLYKLQLSKKDSEGGDLLAGATFQAFEDEACTTPAVLYTKLADGSLQPIENSTFTTGEDGIATCWGLFAGKTYYIKEIHAPPGYSNMSEYVIEFTLSKDGESVFIMIDSNDTQWEFAGKYHYEGGEEHLIELDVYNHKYVGGDEKLYVEKVWADGSEGIPQDITVLLYANGVDTGRSLVLNKENGWKATFYKLPKTHENGAEIEYTVKEVAVEGFGAEYEEITHTETIVTEETVEVEEVIRTEIPGYWNQVSSLTSGKIYQFRYNNQSMAANGTSLSMATISDTNQNQQWLVTGSGTSFNFQNVGTSNYLNMSTSSASLSAASQSLTYSNNRFGYVYSTRYTYYLRYRNNAFSVSRNNYTNFTPYEWVEPTYTEETVTKTETVTNTVELQYKGFVITNTPIKSVDIPVEKLWDSTVISDKKQDVVLNLYLVTIGDEANPEFVSTLQLTEENGWAGEFTGLDLPENGSYYAIIEDTDEFSVSYSGEEAVITLDNKAKTAARVEFDESGTAVKVEITNSVLLLLPKTGGLGVLLIPIFGILLVVVSTALAIKFRKKIRI